MSVYDLLKTNREEILRITKQYGASNVRVFGSVARGQADEKSDIDLLVDFELGKGLLNHAALSLALQQLVGMQVDVVSSRGLKQRMRERVLREAVPL
ncbi:MAG: nucleotidyltransferase family protein [Chloroflexi bacterium]|nr:nucleotidyltransferase family protein [Chloroflexota bacterium]